jgi:hypothetical protein
MIEFRIYYECFEQANDYVAPILRGSTDANIKMVRMPKQIKDNCFKEGVMKAIYSLCVPDILISAVADNVESPLVFIEFTDAVTTEDHELQRSAGAAAAFFADIFYVKVSSDKQSRNKHGGAAYNPYSSARIFFEELSYEGFIVAEWKVADNNNLRRQQSYKLFGCPPDIPVLQETIKNAVVGFQQNKKQWFSTAISLLKLTVPFKEFEQKRDGASTLAELLDVWRKRRITTQRYYVNDKWIGAIIYRFGHAMDPDRGIISFISTLLSSKTEVYGIYSIVRPRTNGFQSEVKEIEPYKKRVEKALRHDKAPAWFRDGIMQQLAKSSAIGSTFDVQQMWEENFATLRSKVYKTLAYFTDGIYLGRSGTLVKWNRWKLLGVEGEHDTSKFFDVVKRKLGFDKDSAATSIKPVSVGITEDEVTYALVHRILIPRGFRIVAVSYPGAQGGYAVLPEAEANLGRAQKRTYHDVIALPPARVATFDSLISESKGMFKQADVEADAAKLQPYKASGDNTHKRGLHRMIVQAQVFTADQNLQTIMIGVAFGAEDATQTCWNPKTVDFIFCVDRASWKIGIFNDALIGVIAPLQGETNLPDCFTLGKS